MKKFNEICDKIADGIVIIIAIIGLVFLMYVGYRYDVNVVKQGIQEVNKQEQK